MNTQITKRKLQNPSRYALVINKFCKVVWQATSWENNELNFSTNSANVLVAVNKQQIVIIATNSFSCL